MLTCVATTTRARLWAALLIQEGTKGAPRTALRHQGPWYPAAARRRLASRDHTLAVSANRSVKRVMRYMLSHWSPWGSVISMKDTHITKKMGRMTLVRHPRVTRIAKTPRTTVAMVNHVSWRASLWKRLKIQIFGKELRGSAASPFQADPLPKV